jgi:hypothetical protein
MRLRCRSATQGPSNRANLICLHLADPLHASNYAHPLICQAEQGLFWFRGAATAGVRATFNCSSLWILAGTPPNWNSVLATRS